MQAKAAAKKNAILDLLDPKKSKKKAKAKSGDEKKETSEAEKNEEAEKRSILENLSDEISKINETKAETEPVVDILPSITKPSKAVKAKKNSNPAEEEEIAQEITVSKSADSEFTGDEDIDENLLHNHHAL